MLRSENAERGQSLRREVRRGPRSDAGSTHTDMARTPVSRVGGFVDAVGYLVLFNLFTAHMSGNSVAMTVHAGEGNWAAALYRGFPIPLFLAGVVVGALLSEAPFRRGMRSTFAPARRLGSVSSSSYSCL